MKIITVLHSLRSGGAERHALQLMRGLRARGHEALFAGSSAIESPLRRRRFNVTSLLSIRATTMVPFSAVSQRSMTTVSPSWMPASTMESPSTVRA